MKRRDFLKGIGKIVAGIPVVFGVEAKSKDIQVPRVKKLKQIFHWHYMRQSDYDLNLQVLVNDDWVTLVTIPAGEPKRGYLPVDLNLMGNPSNVRIFYVEIRT